MDTNNYPKVLQSPFEKAVINAINYLCDNWEIHRKFRHKKELLAEMGLEKQGTNFTNWQKAIRNIPATYHAKMRQVLINDYYVSPKYLDTNRGRMFLNDTYLLNEDAAMYGCKTDDLLKQINGFKKEIERLNKECATLGELAAMQREEIKRLKG